MKTLKKPTKKELQAKLESLDHERLVEIFDGHAGDVNRMIAIGLFLDLTVAEVLEEVVEAKYGDGEMFEYGRTEFRVLTDEEADRANDETIENYIEEIILPQLPKEFQRYFDFDAFKADARHDGRGHNLASYDGEENEVKVEDAWFYIYRTN